ncbi:MAG: hypothetical protein JNM94_18305 [Phycisphaerae bacterium]|nr:hypothetical protein [Phycisphaerae bacterium]
MTYPTRRTTDAIGTATIDSGIAPKATSPKCHAAIGVVASQTAMVSMSSPRTERPQASAIEEGGATSRPYHRVSSAGARNRSASTAANVS